MDTLYPLLRRLEKQGVLESVWDTAGTKPRKFYKMSEFGDDIYLKLNDSWNEINKLVNYLIKEEVLLW